MVMPIKKLFNTWKSDRIHEAAQEIRSVLRSSVPVSDWLNNERRARYLVAATNRANREKKIARERQLKTRELAYNLAQHDRFNREAEFYWYEAEKLLDLSDPQPTTAITKDRSWKLS